jgi:putative DNA primase/helicase
MNEKRDVLGLLPEAARRAAEEAQRAGPLPLTDLGNAERFVTAYGVVAKYCPPRRRWLLWDGQRWAWDERGRVFQFAKKVVRAIYAEASACDHEETRKAIAAHARRSERASALTAMLKLAETEPGVAVMPSELDCHAWLLNCPNGTLDLQTGQLRVHAAADLITKITPVPYDPNARSELWDSVLATAVGSDADLGEYLQRVAGYALSGSAAERAFFFLYGPPGTAKSTLLDALRGAMGEYAVAACSDTFLVQSNTGGNRGDLVRLAGARLVTASEMRPGAKWDTAIIKQVTGGDTIVAAAKYESEVEFKASFTLIVAANDAPRLRDDDEGMWARMRRLPLTAQIAPENQDRDLKMRLHCPEHAAAILHWAVQGCRAWQVRGLGACRAVEASTAEYRDDMDVFSRFLEECCVLEPEAFVSRADFNRRYAAWCRDAGIRHPLSLREIAARLEQRGCGHRIVRGNRRWTGIRTTCTIEG